MLTKKQLQELRKQIVLNSMFLSDYDNTLFIKNEIVAAFFDGYMQYLYEIALDNFFISSDPFDVIKKYDNCNNLWNYYLMSEDDPLIRNDYKAALSLSLYNGILIYGFNYYSDKVYTASYENSYNRNLNNEMRIHRITENAIKYNKDGNPYFIKDKRRYYLNQFMRADL